MCGKQSRDCKEQKDEVTVKVLERIKCNAAFASEFLISTAKSFVPNFFQVVINGVSFLSGLPFEVKA